MAKKAKKECYIKLEELISEVVLVDIEDQIDEIFALVANNADETHENELKDLYEMRDEFKIILQEIKDNELESEECEELYNEIIEMMSSDEK